MQGQFENEELPKKTRYDISSSSECPWPSSHSGHSSCSIFAILFMVVCKDTRSYDWFFHLVWCCTRRSWHHRFSALFGNSRCDQKYQTTEIDSGSLVKNLHCFLWQMEWICPYVLVWCSDPELFLTQFQESKICFAASESSFFSFSNFTPQEGS